jgi:hypothetical protein
MRAIAAATALVATCILGAALAQEAPRAFTPRWEAEPRPADYVRLYPQRALVQNVSGVAVLCCTPRADRSLDCHIGHEWPDAHGFGAASLDASRSFRLAQASYDDYQARSDTQIRLSMMWAAAIVSDVTRNRLVQIDRETGFVCENLTVEAPAQ